MLTKELKEAKTKLEQLQDEEQKAIAKLLEEELQWSKTFQSSQTQLSNLANEALDEYRRNKVLP
ncbi:MAG: hypothetical protein ACXVMI_15510 [Flavisolibacter sp.]